MNLENLTEKLRKLAKERQYDKVLSALADISLEDYQSAELYSLKADALLNLGRKDDKYLEAIEKALSLDKLHPVANYLKAGTFWDSGDYGKAIEFYKIAVESKPKFVAALIRLGGAYFESGDYANAEDCFFKALEINPELSIAYEGLGKVYRKKEEYEKAIGYYRKGLGIAPQLSTLNANLASLYFSMHKYGDALDSINEQLKVTPQNLSALYNRSLISQRLGDFKSALTDLETLIDIAPSLKADEYLISKSESRIIELKRIIANNIYFEVSDIVDKIKSLLLYEEPCVTHYTSLSVAELLILDKSFLRLSEGAFLNDTSEGKELFKSLPSLDISVILPEADTIAQPFTQKPFIGSYVAETKHDDLTMWRMYGKEKMIEARGCAITIDRAEFLKKVIDNFISNKSNKSINVQDTVTLDDNEFDFYRVAYKGEKKEFIIPGAKPTSQKKLNKLVGQLREILTRLNNNGNNSLIEVQNIRELLNGIAFLFKSGEYHYEHEIRLVLKGTGVEKKVINKIDGLKVTPPRVYIELVDISSVIRKITLGPKVENAEEWAASFYYSLEARDQLPEILISHLPFK